MLRVQRVRCKCKSLVHHVQYMRGMMCVQRRSVIQDVPNMQELVRQQLLAQLRPLVRTV